MFRLAQVHTNHNEYNVEEGRGGEQEYKNGE